MAGESEPGFPEAHLNRERCHLVRRLDPHGNHEAENPAFQVKVAFLILAAINMGVFHFRTSRSIARWDTAAVTTWPARFAGACSLASWVGVMLAGRWIGHLL